MVTEHFDWKVDTSGVPLTWFSNHFVIDIRFGSKCRERKEDTTIEHVFKIADDSFRLQDDRDI